MVSRLILSLVFDLCEAEGDAEARESTEPRQRREHRPRPNQQGNRIGERRDEDAHAAVLTHECTTSLDLSVLFISLK